MLPSHAEAGAVRLRRYIGNLLDSDDGELNRMVLGLLSLSLKRVVLSVHARPSATRRIIHSEAIHCKVDQDE